MGILEHHVTLSMDATNEAGGRDELEKVGLELTETGFIQ
jgi:hypothetical protein